MKLNQDQRLRLLAFAIEQLADYQAEYDKTLNFRGDSENKFGEDGYIATGDAFEKFFVDVIAPLIGEAGLAINEEKTKQGKKTAFDLQEKDVVTKAELKSGFTPFFKSGTIKALKYPRGIRTENNWTLDKADLIRYQEQGKPLSTRFFHVQCYPESEMQLDLLYKCPAVFGIYVTTLGDLIEIAKDAPERQQNGRNSDNKAFANDGNKPFKIQVDLKDPRIHTIIRYELTEEDEPETVVFDDEPKVVLDQFLTHKVGV